MADQEEARAQAGEEGRVSLMLHPLTLTEAKAFVKRHHRHLRAPVGGLFAIGVSREGESEPCGVVVAGRPVARMADNGWTAEITRCATDGTRNACSMLYRAAVRAAFAMGYRKVITYTLPEEGGASLRAAAFKVVAERAGGGRWSREGRPRVDLHPLQTKIRWEVSS